MNLSKISIKRPVATIMVMIMVIMLGFVAMVKIPKDLLPDIEIPVAIVVTSYNNASPEEVERMVTEPLEKSLASVENLKKMKSTSASNTSVIVLEFQFGTDMDFASINMREKIAMVENALPDEIDTPKVIKIDLKAIPVMSIYVSGDTEMSKINSSLEEGILDRLNRAGGVASVAKNGGTEDIIEVDVNKEKLEGYGLTLDVIGKILAGENVNLPTGKVMKGDEEAIVRVTGAFKEIEEIENIPMAAKDRSIIRLSDLARVRYTLKEQDSLSRINGENSINLVITKQSDANTVETAQNVEEVLEELKKEYPNLNFNIGFNQAEFINESLDSVTQSAIIGGIMAILVVFLFLRNIHSTFIIGLSIPVSVFSTIALMKAQNMTLNVYTLAALTVTVGMVVDNSVVVLENIFRKRQEINNPRLAAEKGSNEIVVPIISSTLTTVVVFLPIALSGGFTGMIFKDFSMTIVTTLFVSLIVAITVVPMLSSELLTKGESSNYIRFGKRRYKFKIINHFEDLLESLKEWYGNFMLKALAHRKRVIFACIGFLATSFVLVSIVGAEFQPNYDEGLVKIKAEMPSGTTLEDKDKLMKKLENYAMKIPEMENYTVDIGRSSMGMTNKLDLMIILKDKSERKRTAEEVTFQVKKDLMGTIPGAKLTIEEGTYKGGGLGGEAADISLIIKGDNLEKLNIMADDLSDKILKLKDVDTVVSANTQGQDEVQVTIDRSMATQYGISTYSMAKDLGSALNGTTSTRLKVDGEEIDIKLKLDGNQKETIENLKGVSIKTMTGEAVEVGQIANFKFGKSPSFIERENQQRYVQLDINVTGNDLKSVSQDVINLVDNYDFPDGYYYETGGQQKEMVDAFANLLIALLIAIALVYIVLAAQFESLLLPIMVMVSIPFALPGSFALMFLTGTTLSIVSFMGLIMLAGIVVNNAILLVEFIYKNEKTMGRQKALIEAGKMRIRPILMSAGTTCIGMLPLAFGIGAGSQSLSPLAVAIIGGLIASTAVTLVLIPVIYSIFDDKRQQSRQKREEKQKRIAELEEKWRLEDLETLNKV